MDSHIITMNNAEQQSQDTDSTTSHFQGIPKRNLLPWKIFCLVLVFLVSLGWIGIIVLLILEEEWQLVMVAWLLLYAAAHFCYWYCRRHANDHPRLTFRQRLMARLRGVDEQQIPTPTTPADCDCPPSYDELVKSELPPPTYSSVMADYYGGEIPPPSGKLDRVFRSLPLPWFLRKKALRQQSDSQSTTSSSSSDVVVVIGDDNTAGSTSVDASENPQQVAYTGNSIRKTKKSCCVQRAASNAPPTITVEEDNQEIVPTVPLGQYSGEDSSEPSIDLPSYETLMREAAEPVMTPIHRALSRLPSTNNSSSSNDSE